MPNAIEHLAEALLKLGRDELKNSLVLVPTRRSGLFLQKALAEKASQPIWAPQIITIDALAAQLTGWERTERTDLLMRLYPFFEEKVHKEPFEKFFFWGSILLDEFEAIDSALANAERVFQILVDQREIDAAFPEFSSEARNRVFEFWQGFEPNPSPEQQAFSKLWKALWPLYQAFKAHLTENQLCYAAGVLRHLAENEDLLSSLKANHVFILDPGWLSPAAEKIIHHIQARCTSSIFWQRCTITDLFPKDPAFRKRTAWENLPHSIQIPQAAAVPKVEHWTADGSEGIMAAVAAALASPEIQAEKTALVVLNDELLPGILAHIPLGMESNVSLGLPLRHTFLNGWMQALRKLSQSITKASDNSFVIHAQSLLTFSEIHHWPPEVQQAVKQWQKKTLEDKLQLIASPELEKLPWLRPWIAPLLNEELPLMEKMQRWLDQLAQDMQDQSELNQYTVWFFANQWRRMWTGLQQLNQPLGATATWKIAQQLIYGLKTPFRGEPLKGLQILGLRETERLSFDCVIFVEANEGLLPAQNNSPSLIPDFLKEGYGLSTLGEKQRQEALLVFGLMEQAKEVKFISNSRVEGIGSAEPSRFLSWWKIQDGNFPSLAPKDRAQTFERIPEAIEKTDWVAERLQAFLQEKEISPSALNVWHTCGLQFYFKYVEGVEENPPLSDETSPALLGSLTHLCLENIYKSFKTEETLSAEQLKQALEPAKLKAQVSEALKQHFKLSRMPHQNEGEMLIISSLIESFVQRVLQGDLKTVQQDGTSLRIQGQELDLKTTLSLGQHTLRFKGVVDRTDVWSTSKGSTFRLVDYKTGNPVKQGTPIKDWGDLFGQETLPNKEGFQVFMYAWLAEKNNLGENKKLLPQLWFLRGATEPPPPKFRGEVLEDIRPLLPEFEERLGQSLERLSRLDRPFEPTQDLEACTYCAFRSICNR